ncbi:T-cell surface glycoprotein CD3 epsilon chain-like isoform X2 [Simochromis diagramma]|uniref:T-cell surface glycoprotein CD3 epsilon chain-like isoform X2 n=1 Tax=Simochromis diagramma TaxID=43689 RepID=UPI001A7EB301|nr:T-cell surface glycoprotein CD3 epsilon chain-like isoform X2 [Simochromis diagramma]
MLSMGVQAVLVVVLLGVASTVAGKGNVEIWRNQVTLTCPEAGKWNEEIEDNNGNQTYTFIYTSKAQYTCEYGPNKNIYKFYVKGNVCENCFELDGNTLFMVIVGDLLLTIIVMVIVYTCSKKKSSAGPPQPSKAPPRSGGRGPPVPSPDYEALNPQTRAQETYSTVVNRMG